MKWKALPYDLVQTYTTACDPYNYQTLDLELSFANFDAAWLSCALACEAISGCTQIWVGYQNSTGKTGPYGCLTGLAEESDNGWNASEIQCNLPSLPYSQFGEWYRRKTAVP